MSVVQHPRPMSEKIFLSASSQPSVARRPVRDLLTAALTCRVLLIMRGSESSMMTSLEQVHGAAASLESWIAGNTTLLTGNPPPPLVSVTALPLSLISKTSEDPPCSIGIVKLNEYMVNRGSPGSFELPKSPTFLVVCDDPQGFASFWQAVASRGLRWAVTTLFGLVDPSSRI